MTFPSRYHTYRYRGLYWAVNKKLGGKMWPGKTQDEAIKRARKDWELFCELGEDEYFRRWEPGHEAV